MKKIIFLLALASANINAGEVTINWYGASDKSEYLFFAPLDGNINFNKKVKKSNNSNISQQSETFILESGHDSKNKMVRVFDGCITGSDLVEWQCVDEFYIGLTEVTNAEYSEFDPSHNSNSDGLTLNIDNQPVVNISINDAINYTNWLSEKTGKKYRLPTNNEWQYAALAGLKNIINICEYANLRDIDCVNGDKSSSVVGSYASNEWGLYDMFGNVWEMIGDNQQIAKGGSWASSKENVNINFNFQYNGNRSLDIGFRLAMDE